MTTDTDSCALRERSVALRGKRRHRPTIPRRDVDRAVGSGNDAVGIFFRRQPLHDPSRREIDNRERVAQILRDIQHPAIARYRDAAWVPGSAPARWLRFQSD